MIFWKVEELKKQIKMGLLTESTYFKYLLLFITLNAIALEFACYMPAEDASYSDYAESVFNVLVVLLGTVFAFNANGGQQGEKFVEKYLSIGFVTSVRFFIYSIPVIFLYAAFYFYELNKVNLTLTEVVDTLPFLLFYSIMYWRICVHIKQTNS